MKASCKPMAGMTGMMKTGMKGGKKGGKKGKKQPPFLKPKGK